MQPHNDSSGLLQAQLCNEPGTALMPPLDQSTEAQASRLLNGTVTLVVIGIGTALNLISIVLFVKQKPRPLIYNHLIILAVWDTLLLCPGALLMYAVPTAYFGQLVPFMGIYSYVMKCAFYLSHVTLIGTTWTVLLITIDRYLAFCSPLLHQRRVRDVMPRVMAHITLLVVVYALPQLFYVHIDHCLYVPRSADGDGGGNVSSRQSTVITLIGQSEWAGSELYSFWYRIVGQLIFLTVLPFFILIGLTVRIARCMEQAKERRIEMTHSVNLSTHHQSFKSRSPQASNYALSEKSDGVGSNETNAAPAGFVTAVSSPMGGRISWWKFRSSSTGAALEGGGGASQQTGGGALQHAGGGASTTNRMLHVSTAHRLHAPPGAAMCGLPHKKTLGQSSSNAHNHLFLAIIIKFIVSRALCVIIDCIELAYKQAFQQSTLATLAVDVSNLLVVLNSATNFLLYFIYSKNLRSVVKKSLRRPRLPTSTSTMSREVTGTAAAASKAGRPVIVSYRRPPPAPAPLAITTPTNRRFQSASARHVRASPSPRPRINICEPTEKRPDFDVDELLEQQTMTTDRPPLLLSSPDGSSAQ